ncbi:MAG: T9SS type A sorting domain-containing protein [Ferruginibacter sp.]
MKKIILFLGVQVVFLLAMAQNNPCPNILSHGFTTVTQVGTSCTTKVYVNASNDLGSQKGLRIQVYLGTVTGTLLVDECYIVPKRSTSSYYESPSFTVPCSATITYVITRYTASNGSCQGGSCGTTITIEGGPLPIKLSAFNVKRSNTNVMLSWKTESEQNAKEFVIQKRQGNDFVDVGVVAATNNSNGSTYTFTDINNSKSVSEYRIKFVDFDGKYTNSETRAIKGTSADSEFTIFPNPTSGSAKITITDATENNDIQVLDNAGRVIKTITLVNTNSTEINNLQKGVYLIRIVNKASGDVVVKKLTVVN